MAVELRGQKTAEDGDGMSSKPSRLEKITAALTAIEAEGTIADCITATPGAFLWEFYKAWHDNGGQDGGKNRNSIRRMRDVWLTGDNDVKSLHPKLTGKVRVSKDDAKALMSLFLKRWKFVGVKEGDWVLTPDGYAPFPCRDCNALCERLTDAMYPEGSKQAGVGLALPVRSGEEQLQAVSSNWKELAELYMNADAFITISRHKATIGPTPAETIKLFWQLMNFMYESDGDTIFIWIVDIGVRQVEDDNAWKDFLNFEMMKTQFRAIASFDSENDLDEDDDVDTTSSERSGLHAAFLRSLTIPEERHREKRWKWLCERCVIVVQNLRIEEFEHLYPDEDSHADKVRLRDIGVTTENILPSMMPSRWSQLREFRELYGRDLVDISDATLTVLLNSVIKSGDQKNVQYLAHALVAKDAREPNSDGLAPWATTVATRQIPSPGINFDDAMTLIYWAARHRLKSVREDNNDPHHEDWAIATAYLANQGFRVIRLPEFMKIHRSPGD